MSYACGSDVELSRAERNLRINKTERLFSTEKSSAKSSSCEHGLILRTKETLFSATESTPMCVASFKSASNYADVIGLTMTLLVAKSRTLIKLGCDQDEILSLTEIVCKNGKDPLQSESIFEVLPTFGKCCWKLPEVAG